MSQWDEFSQLGGLRSVLDIRDIRGYKNLLLDRIHWTTLKKALPGSGRLLDFGCGNGRFSRRISGMKLDYDGIDVSEKMLEAAKSANPGLRFQGFDGRRLPFPEAAFEACLSCGVYQHLIHDGNDEGRRAEIARVLKPGGRLIMIEQVSRSRRASGTVARVSTEEDYRELLSGRFRLLRMKRVRLCELSKLSLNSIRFGRFAPAVFDRLLGPLAYLEITRARGISDRKLSLLTYYEIFLEAVLK
jgi:SAM-dependent methyltransferase